MSATPYTANLVELTDSKAVFQSGWLELSTTDPQLIMDFHRMLKNKFAFIGSVFTLYLVDGHIIGGIPRCLDDSPQVTPNLDGCIDSKQPPEPELPLSIQP